MCASVEASGHHQQGRRHTRPRHRVWHARWVKVFISVDMEGVAGIVDWAQCLAGGDDYALGRDLLVGEVNAAIEGALAAGATDILVIDAHSAMGTPGVLSHTYNPRAIAQVRLGGVTTGGITTGEAGLNALVAQHFAVPIAVITGDQYVGPEAAPFCPGIASVEVKRSISRYAAQHSHPAVARELVRDGVRAALAGAAALAPPAVPMPATIEVRFTSPDMAEQASWLRGVSRLDEVTVALTDDEPLRLHRAFITLVYLTRSLVESY